MDNQIRNELGLLLESQLEGDLDAEGKQRLAELLNAFPDAKQVYIEHCQMHSMLAWEHGTLPDIEFHDRLQEKIFDRQQQVVLRSVASWRRLAIAAMILCVISFAWTQYHSNQDTVTAVSNSASGTVEANRSENMVSPPRDPAMNVQIADGAWNDRPVFATISRSVGATFLARDAGESLSQSDSVRPGGYELSGGLVELTFNNGVQVIIESPAKCYIESEMRIVLYEGSLAANVPPAGEGFTVDTHSASVVDFGTEFAVSVLPNQGSEVHVFNGEVDVKPRHAPKNTTAVRLRTDQATRVESAGIFPQGIDIDHERYVRELGTPGEKPSRYMQTISELKPTMYLPMEVSNDGQTFAVYGNAASTVILRSENMELPALAPGFRGRSTRFGGPAVESYVVVSDYEKTLTNQLTVSAWIRPESRPRWAAIAKHWSVELADGEGANVGLGGQFHFGLHEDSGDLEVQVRDSNGLICKLREGSPISLNTWHHVLFVADGKTLSLYRNGNLLDQVPCEGVAKDGPNKMGIGGKLNPQCTDADARNPGYWHGRIDELTIFHRALSNEEITQISKSSPE
ncbi:hypothetical protein FHS27_005363 [Rhodopirellula rubra]|uniref:LamG-like jellyroll fold domain-containing protein n=1 Tax=Aporhodopirellula rubra TaxID=980271 RepID=A0A7W5E3P6_9BACT|nr:LamG-like jellyroll fold domain-containing protein [Aporhodopirellula rubra]MBB3209523.1 hypothetical protein [Aporhodopirellula rubra]